MKTAKRPPSSVGFDWAMGLFSVLIMAGVYQDGWAHNHGLVDQSFFTPWHAILYGTMAVAGVFLLVAGVRNMLRGYSFRNGLPFGYWTSAVGVMLFAAGGVFDLWWHTMFGIEIDIQGLVSPSHLTLALGGALVFAGTLRSIGYQYGSGERRWSRVGPAIFASLAAMMLLGFFTQYAAPFADNTPLAIIGPAPAVPGGALYRVRANGTQETRVWSVPDRDAYGVTLSPDGKRMAFRVQHAGNGVLQSDIYVANSDGSGARRITHSQRHATQAAWSPDGTRIAFVSMPAGTSGNFRLETIRPDGSGKRTLIDQVTTLQTPSWSPDSTSIAFTSRNGLTQEIAVVAAGGGAVRWMKDTAGGSLPAWSRHGIAFQTAGGDIALAVPGSAALRTLVKSAQPLGWSPDGKTLLYAQDAGGETQVFASNARGGNPRNLSMLTGLSADAASMDRNDDLYFTATGHARATQTGIGSAYAVDAAIISSIVLMGLVLMLVRRWQMPPGALTVFLGLFAVAAATQSDLYFLIPYEMAVAIASDVYVSVLKDRARGATPFYALAFLAPALLMTLYESAVRIHLGSLSWPPNLLLGTPIVAGFAGLLIAFCFDSPLKMAGSELRQSPQFAQDLASRISSSEQ